MIKVGSLFAGIGGFEKGIEDAFDGMAETVWQVEQNSFCQKVLKKHWPNATIYDDVRTVGKHNLEPVHILCGGFPCQSISVAGKREGLENENKSGLWWEMHRIIGELQPRITLLENVANVLSVGGPDVVGSLAQIGYDCEWTVISARQFGAPHIRKRWFGVAYPNSKRIPQQSGISFSVGETRFSKCRSSKDGGIYSRNYWKKFPIESPLCRRDDGIPNRMDRVAALGNAIVPQCSEWVARQVLNSGLLDDLLEGEQ